MKRYYVNDNQQANGDHEVHDENCPYLPLIISKTNLGYHNTCESAVRKAKEKYPSANGCYTCSYRCHTS